MLLCFPVYDSFFCLSIRVWGHEIDRLRELKQNALVESAEREGLKQRIREMREFLEQQSTEVTEYDELLVRRLIEKVTVYDERFEVEFKSGAKVDVER